jgi:hypothetical protein
MRHRARSTPGTLDLRHHPFHHLLFDQRPSGGVAAIGAGFDPNCPNCREQAVSEKGWRLWYTLACTKTTRLVRLDDRSEVAQRWAEDMANDPDVLSVWLESPLGDLLRLKG